MSILPALLLKADMTIDNVVESWNEDDGTGDPWLGFPYKFKATLQVQAQSHGSHLTPTTFFYTGTDVTTGMWLSGQLQGFAWRITDILYQDGSVVECVIEDVDRYNTFTDLYQTGGYPANGAVVIFNVDDDGAPILTSVPDATFSSVFVTDLIGRFKFRNQFKDFIPIKQPGHGLVKGDMIRMTSSGSYVTVAADEASKDVLGTIVGQVTDVGTPGAEWFTFKPRGELRTGLVPQLPGSAGQLIYLDPVNAGKLVATKPEANAVPIYIQLEVPSKGIYLMGGSGAGDAEVELGPLGYYATVYRVDTIAARDALDTTEMKPGDQVYVTDAGNGEWAHFIASAINAGVVTWTKLVNQDSSDVDGKTISVEYEIGAPSATLDIHSVTPSVRVTLVTIEVTTPFNTTATLNVGDDGLHTRLVDDSLLDLSTAGTYTVTPSYQFGGTGETMVRAYFTPGTSTQGKAKVTISYI